LEANQAVFREVNERLLRLTVSSADDRTLRPLLCECADLDCTEEIELTYAEYDALHAHPHRYAVAVGHDMPGEAVVSANARYAVVEKPGGSVSRPLVGLR
jgi:hypothetical protein